MPAGVHDPSYGSIKMELALQLHHGRAWHDVATLKLEQPARGIRGPSVVAYDLNYFVEHGAIPMSEDRPLTDARALSTTFPVSMEDRSYPTWPPFLLDLLPQGYQRQELAEHLKLDPDAPSTEIHLLMRAGGASVGNMRIKEARLEEGIRLRGSKFDTIHITRLAHPRSRGGVRLCGLARSISAK